MPPIDKGTITVTTAAIIMSCIAGLITTVLTVWFTAVNAVESGFEKVNARIEKLENQVQQMENNNTANYTGLKPEEIKRKNYR